MNEYVIAARLGNVIGYIGRVAKSSNDPNWVYSKGEAMKFATRAQADKITHLWFPNNEHFFIDVA